MRILIAEDDGTSRLFLEKTMEKYGSCQSTVNGLEAMDLLMSSLEQKAYYDVICLDVMLPLVDGIKLLSSYRKEEKKCDHHALIIMTTALNDELTVAQANEAGCDAYLWKPIDQADIHAILEEYNML